MPGFQATRIIIQILCLSPIGTALAADATTSTTDPEAVLIDTTILADGETAVSEYLLTYDNIGFGDSGWTTATPFPNSLEIHIIGAPEMWLHPQIREDEEEAGLIDDRIDLWTEIKWNTMGWMISITTSDDSWAGIWVPVDGAPHVDASGTPPSWTRLLETRMLIGEISLRRPDIPMFKLEPYLQAALVGA